MSELHSGKSMQALPIPHCKFVSEPDPAGSGNRSLRQAPPAHFSPAGSMTPVTILTTIMRYRFFSLAVAESPNASFPHYAWFVDQFSRQVRLSAGLVAIRGASAVWRHSRVTAGILGAEVPLSLRRSCHPCRVRKVM